MLKQRKHSARRACYIIFRSVLPNAVGPLVVQTAFTVANAILLEAGLSFLGLGIQPPTPSLGLMLQEARGYIRTDAWFGICPGLTIVRWCWRSMR